MRDERVITGEIRRSEKLSERDNLYVARRTLGQFPTLNLGKGTIADAKHDIVKVYAPKLSLLC